MPHVADTPLTERPRASELSSAAMCRRAVIGFVCAAPFLGSGASAQESPAPAPRGQRLVEVTRAGPGESVAGMYATQNGVAATRDGGLFVAVTRARGVAPGAPGRTHATGVDLELWRSDDAGASWRRVGSTPTRGDSQATLAADGDLLACAWTATGDTEFASCHWQRFDPRTNRWLGAPVCLATGTGDQDQYFASDLVRTPDGSLVAAIGCHRDPPGPPWTSGWSTALRCLAPGQDAWSPLVQANVATHGCAGSLAVRGAVVDIVYRTNPDAAIHGLRTFDPRTAAFVQAQDENVVAATHRHRFITNTGVPCVDGTGGRTVLHVLADLAPGKGDLVVSFERDGEPARTTTLAADPPLVAGNENPSHFTLARGPGNHVFVYFGKAEERFAKLWQCVVEDGLPAGLPKVVASGDAQAFAQLTGMRASEAYSGLHVAITSRTAAHPAGVVSVFGSWPARTVWCEPRRR